MLLEKINTPQDVKKLNHAELTALAGEIRGVILQKMSKTGGHLASNLGVVELTVALHYVFHVPFDKIIFDVSHQCYTHKILTGRKDAFLKEERYDSATGFSNPAESPFDLFHMGHTSTSVSLACGVAKARDLRNEKSNVIAVIGDGSLDGGEAFEALNYAAELDSGLIVVVNDNDMSIPENHGGLCRLLTALRESDGKASDNYFKALGFQYLFVKDGHNMEELIRAFKQVKDTDRPVVVHCCTQKGKGYPFAEENREKWHWAYPFTIETGEFQGGAPKENYGAIVSDFLLEKMRADPLVTVIAASTPICIGFNAEKRSQAGKQFIDVGIAEQHAVSMAAGMAKNGGKPVFATNSTFIQRAYDQIQQELCIGQCPAVMIVTHGGVAAHTNDTHAGLHDIPLLANIPGLKYLAPANKQEYLAMLDWAIEQDRFPVAIRVPWNGVYYADGPVEKDYSETRYHIAEYGEQTAILALGGFYQLGEQTARLLQEKTGIAPTLINPRFITGIDGETLDKLLQKHTLAVTLEDGILSGGFGAKIAQYYGTSRMKVLTRGVSQDIPHRYQVREMMEKNRLTPEQIVEDILDEL